MKTEIKTIVVLFAVSLISCFLFTSFSFGQEVPKPGEVIDKSNYKKYAHLFPEEFLPGFENGFDGVFKPFSIKIVESKPTPLPKRFVALSEKNRGKFSLDKDGMIVGKYDFNGLPFPEVTPEDKDFATKIMWNFGYNYCGDDQERWYTCGLKRKGEPVRIMTGHNGLIFFYSRLYIDPKPFMDTPGKLYKAQNILYYTPPNLKNLQMVTYNYTDVMRSDDSYLYLPQMRRVLRGESGQRFVPFQGTMDTYDDQLGFNGKVQEFTYKYLGSKKAVVCFQTPVGAKLGEREFAQDRYVMPFNGDNWEVRETYVIEIQAKYPKYPQSKKVVYLDKENLLISYAVIWDRGGKLWKLYLSGYKAADLPNGETLLGNALTYAVDVQFGMGEYLPMDAVFCKNRVKYEDVTPSGMMRIGR